MVESLFDDLKQAAVKSKTPIAAHLDLTYRCNLKCVHCYVVPQDRDELGTSEIRAILEQLAMAGTLYLTLSGGEIFVRQDFFEIAFHARKLHFALTLLTNGSLIDEGVANKILSTNPMRVQISVYSTNTRIHDAITGVAGSLKKSIQAIEMLRERNVKTKISTVIMKQNINDYHDIYQLAQKLGAEFQANYRCVPKTDKDMSPVRYHIDKSDVYRIIIDPIFSNQTEFELEEVRFNIRNNIPCGAGHMSCYISPYGDVYPCVILPIRCGNLREKGFIDIWRNSYEMQRIRSIAISGLPVCSKCDILTRCRRCMGLAYLQEGDILAPVDGACLEAKIRKSLEEGIKAESNRSEIQA